MFHKVQFVSKLCMYNTATLYIRSNLITKARTLNYLHQYSFSRFTTSTGTSTGSHNGAVTPNNNDNNDNNSVTGTIGGVSKDEESTPQSWNWIPPRANDIDNNTQSVNLISSSSSSGISSSKKKNVELVRTDDEIIPVLKGSVLC